MLNFDQSVFTFFKVKYGGMYNSKIPRELFEIFLKRRIIVQICILAFVLYSDKGTK